MSSFQVVSAFEPLMWEARWHDLEASANAATPFQSWSWVSSWFAEFGEKVHPQTLILKEGDDWVGVFPLVVSRGPWRALRAAGSGPSDYLHPLVRPGYELQFAEALAEWLKDQPPADLIDLHQIRENQPLASKLDVSKLTHQATCLLLDLPDSWDAYLAMLGKSLRYDVRRLDRDVFASGKAAIEWVTPDRTESGMDVLFELHKQRWRKRGLPGAFVGSRLRRFQERFAVEANRRGELRLGILKVDSQPKGAIYAMQSQRTVYYYQAGFDPEEKAISPGTLLVAATIRRAIDDGCQHFDFLRGDEPYKRRWKPQHVLKNLRYLQGIGPRGAAALQWIELAGRVEARLRARFEGRGLRGQANQTRAS